MGPSCCGRKPWWIALGQSRGHDLAQVGIRKMSASKPFDDASFAEMQKPAF